MINNKVIKKVRITKTQVYTKPAFLCKKNIIKLLLEIKNSFINIKCTSYNGMMLAIIIH